jgi:hypothetical protein
MQDHNFVRMAVCHMVLGRNKFFFEPVDGFCRIQTIKDPYKCALLYSSLESEEEFEATTSEPRAELMKDDCM